MRFLIGFGIILKRLHKMSSKFLRNIQTKNKKQITLIG
jgi:hypothetical protein